MLRAQGLAPQGIGRFVAARLKVPMKELLESLERHHLSFVAAGSQYYPPEFLHLNKPPAGLFVAGGQARLTELLQVPRITIVGTRRASAYGLAVTSAFAKASATAQVAVVSGLALGIDARAHEAALDAGGLTVAILGSGAEAAYPRRHRHLHQRIRECGLVLSELPPGSKPAPWSFPLRNRLLAALGDAVLVTEAGIPSGALITVDRALELGREVFAVPGAISEAGHVGCNRLLKDGARAALLPEETMQEFFDETRNLRNGRGPARAPFTESLGRRPGDGLTPVGRLVWMALAGGPLSVEELVQATGAGASEVAAACSLLELRGEVLRAGPGRYLLPP